jgi:tRNA pseudouridine13 synthase
LPYITAGLPGVGGTIKDRPEDFFVEEIPLYECSGEGTHVYAEIEKRGLATLDALIKIAKALGIARRNIGYAGLKDARAVTRQWISIEHIDPERLTQLHETGIEVCQIQRHANKIKMGHLAGNRFIVRIRNLAVPVEEGETRARSVLDILSSRGVPNYFGPQRFGGRGDNQLLGAAIIHRNSEQFIDIFLGLPDSSEQSVIYAARTLYEQGKFAEAHQAWPKHYHDQRRALRVLMKNPANKAHAFNVIDKNHKRFFVSAFQSDLFNQVVSIRIPHIDKLLLGDMAYKHANGACFRVEDPEAEQPRCAAFEISPTGPLYGYRTTEATGPAGEIETSVLAPTQLEREDFRRMSYYRAKGARRPLRFQPREIDIRRGADAHGVYLELEFVLDSGCYATTLIREITKPGTPENQ